MQQQEQPQVLRLRFACAKLRSVTYIVEPAVFGNGQCGLRAVSDLGRAGVLMPEQSLQNEQIDMWLDLALEMQMSNTPWIFRAPILRRRSSASL
jgi:hypothetical protein